MPQIFRRSADTYLKLCLVGLPLVSLGAVVTSYLLMNSPAVTAQNVTVHQTPPFSHSHHVGGLGIGCRMCHSQVEKTAFAGMPATHVCMTCHSQIWTNAPMLAPVRKSLAENKPLVWARVHNLPDYVYFDHRVHVNNGVGCSSCHGPVDAMPLMRQAAPLYHGLVPRPATRRPKSTCARRKPSTTSIGDRPAIRKRKAALSPHSTQLTFATCRTARCVTDDPRGTLPASGHAT